MKQWLQRICFAELYFSAYINNRPQKTKRGRFERRGIMRIWVLPIVFFAICSYLSVGRFTFYAPAISGMLAAFFAFALFGNNPEKMAYLRTLPLSSKDLLLGRFIWALFFGLISSVTYVWGLYVCDGTLPYDSGMQHLWTLSHLLVFGLVNFGAVVLAFSLSALMCSVLSSVAFLWVSIPAALAVLWLTHMDRGANLVRHLWKAFLTNRSGLLVFLLLMGFAGLCYAGMAYRMSRWQAKAKVSPRRPLVHLAAAMVLVFGALVAWKATQYRSPVRENLPPEEQYQIALNCLEDGDIYGAAVSFYACGEYGDARARCWEMWDKIAPRSTIAVNEYQVAALTADGGVLITSIDICNPDLLDKFVGSEITPEDIANPQELISIHGKNEFMVGLYADGTVGLWGDLPGEEDEEIAQWTDIVALFPDYNQVVGLRADGTALCCGDDFFRIEAPIRQWKDMVAVVPSVDALGLRPDGTVIASGNTRDGRHSVGLWRNVVAVVAGNYHTAALHADGTVSALGINESGQCDTREWTDIVAIDAGLYSTVGLRSDGTVVMTGFLHNAFVPPVQNELAAWRDVVAISVSGEFIVGLRSDGTLLAVAIDCPIQEAVSGWENVRIPNQNLQ